MAGVWMTFPTIAREMAPMHTPCKAQLLQAVSCNYLYRYQAKKEKGVNKNRWPSLMLGGMLGTVSVLSQVVWAGTGEKAHKPDKRTLLSIPYEDREDLLRVMRKNISNLGQMINAMAKDDFKTVEKLANEMSFNKKKGQGLARRGNPAFTAMGVQFHAVDTLAVKEAAESKDRKGTLRAMSRMVSTCVTCHATFRVMEWPDNKVYRRPNPTPLFLPPGFDIRSK